MTKSKKIRALGLCSGGLDSMLAGLVLRQQGIDVTWISFETPFFSADKARVASRMTGIPLIVENITRVYLPMLLDPPAGYGKNMNPCMDCHSFMFNLAGQRLEAEGFDFLFSGEVLGQRPFSQNKSALGYVAKHSGYKDLILRPLSAKRLAETLPEKEGWVDREKLLDLSGRGRKAQMALAKEFGIQEYPTPAGGCLLTDVGYSRRLRDLVDLHGLDMAEREMELLKHGRHFRINQSTKAVVGRTKADNRNIMALADSKVDAVVSTVGIPGPKVLVVGGGDAEGVKEAAGLCASYTKAKPGDEVKIDVRWGKQSQALTVITPDKDSFRKYIL